MCLLLCRDSTYAHITIADRFHLKYIVFCSNSVKAVKKCIQYLKELSDLKGDTTYYDILKEVEGVFRERMEEKGKPIYPNVDFFSGAVYALLGIPKSLFTPMFAMSRAAGWLGHILEQRHDNRLFRPKALYTGEEGREFVPLTARE